MWLDNSSVLDVAAAAEALAAPGDAASWMRAATLMQYLRANDDAAGALDNLVQRAREVPRNEAIAGGFVQAEREVRFLPPMHAPGKFLCVGKNYRAHLEELVRTDLIREIPEEPTAFVKLNATISAHGDDVPRPSSIEQLDYEPELAFVIGRGGRRISKDDAMAHVFGVTLFNDLTAREIQRREVKSGTRFWTAKNMPRFGPIGPYVVTLDEVPDVNDLDISCYVNGEFRMSLNTSDQIFKIPDIIEHFSRYIPLEAGDLFATGSAAGVAVGQENAEELFLRPGDKVEVVLDGFMTLENHIVDDKEVGSP